MRVLGPSLKKLLLLVLLAQAAALRVSLSRRQLGGLLVSTSALMPAAASATGNMPAVQGKATVMDGTVKKAATPEAARAQIAAGFTEINRLLAEFDSIVAGGGGDNVRRALGVELQVLTRYTGFLATTAAAAPFIGLFGTVWGIMQAFNDIGVTGSTSITAVAPGIAGALINTAAGLAAADRQRASTIHGIDAVEAEVEQGLEQELSVSLQLWHPSAQLRLDLDRSSMGAAEEVGEQADDLVDGEVLGLRAACPREAQQIGVELRPPLRHRQDEGEIRLEVRVSPVPVARQ